MFSIFVRSVIAGGTMVIVIYCITMFIRYRGSGSWTLISGIVERYHEPSRGNGGLWSTTVSYSYAVDGQQYSGRWMTPLFRNPPALNEFLAAELPIGKAVDVRYNPRRTDRSVLDDPPSAPAPEIVMKTDFTG